MGYVISETMKLCMAIALEVSIFVITIIFLTRSFP